MTQDMKTILTRMFTVALLMMVSLGVRAEVKVLFGEKGTELQPAKNGTITLGQKELTGGTVIISQEDQKDGTTKVTFAVTPDKSYKLAENGLEVYAVIPTDISPTRGLEVSTTLTLKSEDFKDEALKRTYTTTIDSKLNLLVKSANFLPQKRDGAKSTTLPPPSGIWYIGSRGYNPDETADNFYLCPTEGWAFYVAPNNVQGGDNGQPFLTTYQCRNGNSNYDAQKAIWNIEKDQSSGCYYIKQVSTGRYIVSNGVLPGAGNTRARVHLETVSNAAALAALGDLALFEINYDKDHYDILPHSGEGRDGNNIYLVVNTNNYNQLDGNKAKTNGPTGFQKCGGIIGLYTHPDGGNAYFYLEDAHCATPTISLDGTTGEVTIETTTTGATIYYTTNGSTPDPGQVGGDNPTKLYDSSNKPIISTETTIKAIAVEENHVNSLVASLSVSQVATPTIEDNGENGIIITCETEGATIFYTLDPSEEPATPYTSGTILREGFSNKTIRVIAKKSGNLNSEIGSGSVKLKCDPPIISQDEGKKFTLSATFPSVATLKYSINDENGTYDDYDGTPVLFSDYGDVIYAKTTHADYYDSDVTSLEMVKDLEGEGTAGSPYLITSQPEFALFVSWINNKAEKRSLHYKLQADINGGAVITQAFTGILEGGVKDDGSFYKISNLHHALFNTVNGGTVKNVILDNVSISGGTNVGAICNEANGDSRIYNCGILATNSTIEKDKDGYDHISSSSSTISGSGYVGGIVGLLDGTSRVINCFSYADVSGGSYVGGIVGYNNVASTNPATELKTMVMNCMFYGEVSGSSIAPIYNGNIITNIDENKGVGNYNYFRLEASYVQPTGVTYNCALGAEDRYLQRFEFFRNLLNSHRELAGWWATGTYSSSEMMKWVLEPSQLGTSTPYPILKVPGKYPSVVNIDAENAPLALERNKGGKLGTLSVTISGTGGGAVYSAPDGASISTGSLTLNITDKDPDHFNFNYYKVQLPYYNDVGTGNYTGNRVVTGWKITSITGGTAGTFKKEDSAEGYNFADRNCTNKDLYSVSGRIFNQGAYWDVPEGVTAITIQPYWAKCVYLADPNADKVYNTTMDYGYDVPNVGGGTIYTNGNSYSIAGENQVVYTSIGKAIASTALYAGYTDEQRNNHSVYDYAVVLVGNYHHYYPNQNNLRIEASRSKPYTVTSIDLDGDNEPDYSYILRFDNRQETHPVRADFINIPGLGMAQKSTGGTGSYNFGIMIPKGWFEGTNTSLFRFTQFEYENSSRSATDALILQGGIMEQWVSYNQKGRSNKIPYIHVGSNVWFKEFHTGCHQDKNITTGFQPTKHSPISVTGGDFDKFYLTGLYVANVGLDNYADNAECYINGGRFGTVCGAAMEGIGAANGENNTGNITWIIQNADIKEFFAGGLNGAKPVTGNLSTTIVDSHVGLFCGGPKFGDMSAKKTVVTNATGCTFGTFFGAGYGGNSYSRDAPRNHNNIVNFPHNDAEGAGNHASWNAWLADKYKKNYDADKGGISTQFDYQFLPMSNNTNNVARIFVEYVAFSLATTHDVTSSLTGCTITGNFYGGGSLGKVEGDVASTLTNCEIQGSAFGAGYSASLPTVEVDSIGFRTEPYYYTDLGTYRKGVKGSTTTYTWEGKTGNLWVDNTNHILYTDQDLTALGSVTGKATLTINGTTTVLESVYGGGEESAVGGNTEVNITGGTIGTTGKGGATWGNVYGGGKGKADDVTAGIVKGSTTVSISGSPAILHNVYGGGAYGSVGTFSYDATGFPTGWTTTENKGKCTVSITGGTIGTTGDNNGMVFGSSRGLEGNPETNTNVDKMAWVYDTDVTIGTQSSETGPSVKGSVYGGGENGHNFHDAKVTVHSGTIGITEGSAIVNDGGTPDDTSDDISYTGARFPNRGNVYGSGCGTDTYIGTDSKTYFDFNAGIVRGNTTVLIKGGHVVHNVYGGGAMGSVGTYTFDANGKPISCEEGTGTCTVTVSGGQIGVAGAKMAGHGKGGPDDYGHVFGAGRGEMHDPDQYPNMETCAFFNKTILNISGTAFLTGSAYGGSESGHVLGDTEVTISGGQIGCGKAATEPYGTDVWADDYTPTGESLDCASWPFESPFAPYDPFANETGDLDKYPNGKSTDGGRLEASDGHTYYGNVFGGGSGSVPYFDETEGISKYLSTAGSVEGKTTINITGGHIITNVYGGCEATNVKGSATITMTGGTVGVPRTVAQIIAHPNTGYIFGAGKGDQRIFFNKETNVDRTAVNIEGGRVYGSIFGGGEDGHVFQNAIVNIGKDGEDGPTIGTTGTSYVDGNVFGGGRGFGGEALTAGNIGGSIELNIKSGKILGSVYGGGRMGSVGYGLYLVDEEIEEGGKTIKPYGILRPNDKYDGSYPDPSTEPASTYYNKGRGYITINISGGTIGNDAEYIYNPTAEQKAAIPNTTFDYQNHLQYTKGGNVFTGGMGRLYALDNTTLLPLWPKLGKCKGTTLNMTGGTVKSSIYGGGEIGAVAQNATVNITGGTIGTKVVDSEDATKYYYFGSVFGGGKGSTDAITYPGGTAEADQIPISEAGTIGGDVQVNLNNGVAENKPGGIVRQVFGCNDMNGSPKGDVTVHIYATQTSEKADISTKPAKKTNTYDVQAVYGGGNLAAYKPDGGKNTTKVAKVIIDGCELTSIETVYGGGNAASTPATEVTVNGTYEIYEMFGGGNGKDKLPNGTANPGANVGFYDYSAVESTYPTKEDRAKTAFIDKYTYGAGKATVNIFGGTIHRVFGGSNMKGNVRQTALTLLDEGTECQFCVDEAYGGGKSAEMDAEAQLLLACIPGLDAVYGGAEAADVHGNVTLNITNGTFDRVFGGNNISGTIGGSITVNVEEIGCKPVKIGELYGGGNQAGYSVYGYDSDGKPKETGTRLYNDPQVNVMSFTSIGDIYGGGYGSGAKMVGNPTVNINEAYGKYYDNDLSIVGENAKTPNNYPIPSHAKGKMGAISNVFGGGNAAKVIGNTTVNIGTLEEVYVVKEVAANTTLPAGCYTRSGAGTTASPFVYTEVTGPASADVTYYEKKDVLGADIRGNVYGGGNNAEVTGNTNVTIGKKEE